MFDLSGEMFSKHSGCYLKHSKPSLTCQKVFKESENWNLSVEGV